MWLAELRLGKIGVASIGIVTVVWLLRLLSRVWVVIGIWFVGFIQDIVGIVGLELLNVNLGLLGLEFGLRLCCDWDGHWLLGFGGLEQGL